MESRALRGDETKGEWEGLDAHAAERRMASRRGGQGTRRGGPGESGGLLVSLMDLLGKRRRA